MNQGQFAGRVGRDAQLRSTPSGKSVMTFPIGVDTWAGSEKRTLWVNCSMWGSRTEKLCEILLKGTPVAVCGDVTLRTWEKAGRSGASLDLKVANITLLGRVDQKPRQQPPGLSALHKELDGFADDEIPF